MVIPLTERDETAVTWLLESDDPSIRYATLVELLDVHPDSQWARSEERKIVDGPKVRALLAGQQPDGGFGVSAYAKWTGAHWRLVSLADLNVPADDPHARAAAETVLDWLNSEKHRRDTFIINGLARRHASQEGNALTVCSHLGMGSDPRVARLAELLLSYQWPDGGWNCSRHKDARHSSFYESITPLKGLIAYRSATGDDSVSEAIERGGEFFLSHGLMRSERTGEVINQRWLDLHYPLYWHYDVPYALNVLAPLGVLDDPRLSEALDLIERKRLPDGRWRPKGYYWRMPGSRGSLPEEVVDWGRGAPNEMITLNARRALKAAGRAMAGLAHR